MLSFKKLLQKVFNKYTILLLINVLFTTSCMKLRTSDKKVYRKFSKKDLDVSVHYVDVNNKKIRYIKSGSLNLNKPLIVFVHGAPGSADDFFEYMMDDTLVEKAQLISVDRLGYGFSEFGDAEKSIVTHADALRSVLTDQEYSSVILVGHSYGGPIICEYAVKYPSDQLSLLLLAPAIDPKNEKTFKIAYLAKWKSTKFLIPKPFQVSAVEKFSHVSALNEVVGGFSKIPNKIIHLHGTKDRLVPFANLAFGERTFTNAQFNPVKLKGKNHFLPWNSKPIILEHILELMDEE